LISTVKILLADDDPKVLSALRLLFQNEPRVSVVGESTSAPDLVETIGRVDADLVLLDWDLPLLLHDDLVRQLSTVRPTLRVIALSGRTEARLEALNAGVDAFVCKGDPPDVLLAAVREIAAHAAH
jgi:DNA-binding NarL/FixJ family response regulator